MTSLRFWVPLQGRYHTLYRHDPKSVVQAVTTDQANRNCANMARVSMLYRRIVEAVLCATHIVHPALPQYDPCEQCS